MSPRPSEYSTDYKALQLVKKIIDGFKYHPYFFILRAFSTADPPIIPYAHQQELILRSVFRRPIRVLIGDEIGLGKTIEAIAIAKFLEEHGEVRKILVLVPRILLEQWLSELQRAGITRPKLKRIERHTIGLLRDEPGWYVASIDLVKREEHRGKITGINWDLVIVDEVHRVGKVGGEETLRYELVKQLVSKPDVNVLFLSATPHRGKADDYIERLRLVDPYLQGSVRELDTVDFYMLTRNSIVFRRSKNDINRVYEKGLFPSCSFEAVVTGATEYEKEFNKLLLAFLRGKLLKYYEAVDERPSALPLLLTLVAKRASSSPKAALSTFTKILIKRDIILRRGGISEQELRELDREAKKIAESLLGAGFEDYSDYEAEGALELDEAFDEFVDKTSVLLDSEDLKYVEKLFELAKRIKDECDSRLRTLIDIVKEHLDKGDKVVVFTEFRDTASYIYENLKDALSLRPCDIAFISSQRIEYCGRRVKSIEEIKRALLGGLKVIVSTDVASEGLNLQAANVVIHYEPVWSPIKILQRVGRIWRLGQIRDVYSINLILTVESDMAVLSRLYDKILALIISGVEDKPLLGDKLKVIVGLESGERAALTLLSRAEESPGTLTTMPVKETRFSEYRAILEFLRKGAKGLEEYVSRIIAALKSLRNTLRRVGLERVAEDHKVTRLLDDVLGGLRGENALKILTELVKAVGLRLRYDIVEKDDKLFMGDYIIDKTNHASLFRNLMSMLPEDTAHKPLTLISSVPNTNIGELHLYEVKVTLGGKAIFSEVIGISVSVDGKSIEIIRGLELLEVLTDAINGVMGFAEEASLPKGFEARITGAVSANVRDVLSEYRRYKSEVERRGFAAEHRSWVPQDLDVDIIVEYIGSILFTTMPGEKAPPPPPYKREEVERKAMEIAMDYEKSCGRMPKDVSMYEHYDIESFNPRTGEMRYIEVKGVSGLSINVELTEAEFKTARRLGQQYWLYVICGLSTGKPRIICIKDPANTLSWYEKTIRRYRLGGD